MILEIAFSTTCELGKKPQGDYHKWLRRQGRLKTSSNNKIIYLKTNTWLSKIEQGKISLDFRIEGKKEQAIFDYRYDDSNQSLDYTEINYTNPKLQSLIENNAKMMENIDSYIRNIIEKKRSSLHKGTK